MTIMRGIPFTLMRLSFGYILLAIFSLSLANTAEAKTFPDVPADADYFAAVDYLSNNGVIEGNPDGTFKPNDPVNRAAAVKMIVASVLPAETFSNVTTSSFADVSSDAWFHTFVEVAKDKGIIDGPPKKTAFNPSNTVIKAELLKIAQIAYGVDTNMFSEIRLPLAHDATNPDEWFHKHLRTGLATSMIMISDQGTLEPGKALSRAEVAQMVYYLKMYQEGRRVQSLLSLSETNILIILDRLENDDIAQAEYASARALVAARGAHASKSDEPIVRGAVKVSEAFRSLVTAYRAGKEQRFADVVDHAKAAWGLAEETKAVTSQLVSLAEQVQKISSNMAESARNANESASE